MSSASQRPAQLQQALDEARASASAGLPPIQAALGDFIRYRDWDLFATLTFENPVHPEQAHRRFLAWIRSLEHSKFRDQKERPIIWIRSADFQRRQVLHYHALLARVTGVPPLLAMRLWEQIGLGFARVVPYGVQRGGAYYLAKRADEIDVSTCWFDDPTTAENPS